MASISILCTDPQLGKQCVSKIVPNLGQQYSYSEEAGCMVYRQVHIQSNSQVNRINHQKEHHCHGELSDNSSPRMCPLKDVPSNYNGSSDMDCDDDGTDTSEPRMKYLKSFPEQSTSTDSGITGISEQVSETKSSTADIYLFNMTSILASIMTIASSCLPNGLLIVPIPANGFSGSEEIYMTSLLCHWLQGMKMNSYKEVPRILFVNTHNEKTNGFHKMDLIEKRIRPNSRHNCCLGELQQTVNAMLSAFPNVDYMCIEEDIEEDTDMFVLESDLSSDLVNALLKQNKIFRFESKKKTYICTHPDRLLISFYQATKDFNHHKVHKQQLLSAMNIERNSNITIAALCSLGLIVQIRSSVFIVHMFRLGMFDIGVVSITKHSTVLRFISEGVVNTLELLVYCESSGWQVQSSNGNIDLSSVFLLTKNGCSVLVWLHEINDKVNVNVDMFAVTNTELSDRNRDTLASLRQCVQTYLKCEIKISHHCLNNNATTAEHRQEEVTADLFIEECIDTYHWLDSRDTRLYYLIDAQSLLRQWISPSEEQLVKRLLNGVLTDELFSKLSADFGSDSELFFIEQGVKHNRVKQIQQDNIRNFKATVQNLLRTWAQQLSIEANLFTLRNAIVTSKHTETIDTRDFDKTVEEYLQNTQRDSLFPPD